MGRSGWGSTQGPAPARAWRPEEAWFKQWQMARAEGLQGRGEEAGELGRAWVPAKGLAGDVSKQDLMR